MSKLAKININNSTGSKLTQNSVDMLFSLTLKYPLENNYNFKKLKSEHLREFQSFLDKVSSMTFSQVDNLFLRNPDTNDKFQGKQIQHYEVSNCFRIHGVIEDSHLVILRIDPRHDKHK